MGCEPDDPEDLKEREAASADGLVLRWRTPYAWYSTVAVIGLAALWGGFLAMATLSLAFRTDPEPTNAFQLVVLAVMWILAAKLVGASSLRISFMRHAKLTLTSTHLIYVDNCWRRAALDWDTIVRLHLVESMNCGWRANYVDVVYLTQDGEGVLRLRLLAFLDRHACEAIVRCWGRAGPPTVSHSWYWQRHTVWSAMVPGSGAH